jgi:hypothetical protein
MADEEIKEIRAIRHEISREFDHDLDKVVAYYRKVEDELKRSGKFRFSSEQPRKDDHIAVRQ